MDKIFVATSDTAVMSQLRSSVGAGVLLAWTGSSMAQSVARRSDGADAAISAVLDDVAGLASASVVVGTCRSGVFGVARALNLHLHLRVARSHPWCYDVRENRVCD